MVHLMPPTSQRQQEAKQLINDLTDLIAKANSEGKHWTVAKYICLKELIIADLKKMG